MRHRAGERVEVVVTYLEMEARPGYPRPHLPTGPASALIGAERPPVWYFLGLYDAVGRDYDWTDQHERPAAEVAAFLHDPAVTLYTFMRAGWPHGFFVLDGRAPRDAATSPISGWCRRRSAAASAPSCCRPRCTWPGTGPGPRRVTVNTNSLDHPRALPLYQKAGFVPVRRETRSRVLSRDRDMIDA